MTVETLPQRRERLALQAPITYEVVLRMWDKTVQPNLCDDREREAFFSVWALAAYEWADMMIWQAGQAR